MTHSRFAAANSFSLLTSSLNFVSVESISHPFLSSSATSLLKRLRLRFRLRQIHQIRCLPHRCLRRSLPRPSLPSRLPTAFQRSPQAPPPGPKATRSRPTRPPAGPPPHTNSRQPPQPTLHRPPNT